MTGIWQFCPHSNVGHEADSSEATCHKDFEVIVYHVTFYV